jgi:hypothetical protein
MFIHKGKLPLYSVDGIRRKKLWELYTPSGANKDGFSDRDDFIELTGNSDFHSFQVWRSSAEGEATCVYGLTFEQLTSITKLRNHEIGGFKGQITKLSQEVARLKRIEDNLKILDDENIRLQDEIDAMKERNQVLSKSVTDLQTRLYLAPT